LLVENGNLLTAWLHQIVSHELNRLRLTNEWPITAIIPEKSVLLTKNGSPRPGRFDFLVQLRDRTIGFEVLSRPSQGKMRQKLAYASEVDEFVFVLPKESLSLYHKTHSARYRNRVRPNKLGHEFTDPRLSVWVVDIEEGKIVQRGVFSQVFNAQ
jgi:hypothetical protein